jgi:hypothetical protein
MLAAACLGVPFVAGAKLLDSVRPAEEGQPKSRKPVRRRAEPRQVSRNRPRHPRLYRGSALPRSRRTD